MGNGTGYKDALFGLEGFRRATGASEELDALLVGIETSPKGEGCRRAVLLHKDCMICLYEEVMQGRDEAGANISARLVAVHERKHLALNSSVDVQGDRATALCHYPYMVPRNGGSDPI